MAASIVSIPTRRLADHSADWRMVMLAGAAAVVGTGAAFGAWALLKLIAVATNLFWFGRLSAAPGEIRSSTTTASSRSCAASASSSTRVPASRGSPFRSSAVSRSA